METVEKDNDGALFTDADSMSARSVRERLRLLKDKVFAALMAIGGISVIVAILLIFIYLFYVVIPLFKPADIIEKNTLTRTSSALSASLLVEEYAEIALDVDTSGHYQFFHLSDAQTLSAGALVNDDSFEINHINTGDLATHVVLAASTDGRAVVAQAQYTISYPENERLITPTLTFPLGQNPVELAPDGAALSFISGQIGEEESTLVGVGENNQLYVLHALAEQSLLDDEVSYEFAHSEITIAGAAVTHIALDIDQRELYVMGADGALSLYDLSDKSEPKLVDRASVTENGQNVTSLEFLSGGISVLLGMDDGSISQWFPVRDDNNIYSLRQVRTFSPMSAAVVRIAPEYFRKAFGAIDANGNLALYHTTAERLLAIHKTGLDDVSALALAPRANAAVVFNANQEIHTYDIHNEHPEVSWRALWGKVFYESRQQPEYIWQSSSASSDFEPKFSLTPLTFGTLKATFYSMLFATPLAVLGAIYTAYFMTPAMRSIVKPSIEVMAALPTVILGFLAGLWLAPLIERELAGLTLCLVVVPTGVVAAAWLWSRLPASWRGRVAGGWEALLLVPVMCLLTWLTLESGHIIEAQFFSGSLTHWLTTEWGIPYDQRNSLVVGVAIGFAVIPTIFSISEDAVFSVPRSLTAGSLALGATPWQTAIRVVLLTASPGIFSAVMIGMGRAVGETMIVLMATGNTPIMDANIFQGFRALSANIAVEMPESEVGSSHYRILFLTALVLFVVTFFVNTLAELVRQRLRRKYASL